MISHIRRVAGLRRALIGAAMVALLLVLAPASPAAADGAPAPVSAAVAAGTSGIVDTAWTIPDFDDGPTESEVNNRTRNYVSNTTLRTLNRWGDSANSFHTKFDGFIGTQLADMAQRTMVQGGAMGFGNWAMRVTSEFTQFAVNLDIINGLGAAMDGIVKTMLNALIGVTGKAGAGVLFGIIALLSVIIAIWRNARAGFARMAREVGAIVIVIAVVFGIGMTTLNYKPGSGDTYKPAPASPGWLVKGVNDTITDLTALPAKTFVDGVEGAVWGNELGDSTRGGGLGCSKYTSAMAASFDAGALKSTTNSRSQVSIAQVTDSLWDSTGLYVWAMTQAGYQNPYAAKVYCRILDFRSGAAATSNARMTYVAALNSGYGASATSLNKAITTDASLRAPFAPSSAENTTASIVAWAACKPTGFGGGRFTWEWERDWIGFQGGTGAAAFEMTTANANEECQSWWEATSPTNADGTATGGQDIPDIFDVKGDSGWIAEHTAGANGSASVRDFLFGITGVNPWGGTTGVLSYAVGSFLTMVAFGFIDIVVIVAKLFTAMFILSLWFVLIGAMFRPSEMKDRLAKTFNKFLGTAVFAAMTTIILTFVIVFTRALIRIGIDIWGAGSVGSMLWSGMAPVLALLLVHIMFTRVFKLPSPVSLRGAQAWSKSGMSGALGAGVGAGIGSYAGSRLGGLAKNASRRVGGQLADKITGGRFSGVMGTRSAMAPAGKKAGTGISEQLAARVDAGEQLTRKEQRAVDKVSSAEKDAQTKREWTLADDAAKAQAKVDRGDLRAARKEFRQETGVAAPGDLAGALALGASGAAAAAGAKVKKVGTAIADKTGLTALRSELGSRRDARRATIEARKLGTLERKAAREAMKAKGAATVAEANRSASSVIDSASGTAKRAAWGITAPLSAAAGARPNLSTLLADGAAASQTVSMMGGAGGAAALTGAITGGLGGGKSARSMNPARTVVSTDAPSVITDVVTPQVEAAPVVQAQDIAVVPGGAAQMRAVPGPVLRTEVPAGTAVGDVRSIAPSRDAVAGAAKIKVAQARIAQSGTPAKVAGQAAGAIRGADTATASSRVTPAVGRLASVIGAPAAGAHAARQQVWKAKDVAGQKVSQVVNSRGIQAAVNDAKVARAAVGVGVDKAKQTAAYRGAESAAQRAAVAVAKGAKVASAGAQALAQRKTNNAEVLANYRERKTALAEAAKATQAAVDAAHVKGKGNTPGGTTTRGKDGV